jgi:hypothetical protein
MTKVTFNENTPFHQKIGWKFEENTRKLLHLEHHFAWC